MLIVMSMKKKTFNQNHVSKLLTRSVCSPCPSERKWAVHTFTIVVQQFSRRAPEVMNDVPDIWFLPCLLAAFLLLLLRNGPASHPPYNQHSSCIKVFKEWKCNAEFFHVLWVTWRLKKPHFKLRCRLFLLPHKVSVDLGHGIIHDLKKKTFFFFVNVDIWTSYLRGKTGIFSLNC